MRNLRLAAVTLLWSATAFGAPQPIITTTSLPDGYVGDLYHFDLAAANGTGPYVWPTKILLPPGLSLSASGTLSGVPTSLGVFGFAVVVFDSNGVLSPETNLTLRINPARVPSPAITTKTLPKGIVGVSYGADLAAIGGVPPYVFSLDVSGSLPPGLTLSPSGLISGTPTSVGTSKPSFLIQDSKSAKGDIAFVIPLEIQASPNSVPLFNQNGVVSVAGPGSVPGLTPGGWVSIFGTNLSATTRAWRSTDFTGNKLPTQLDGVSVSVDNRAAYPSYISPQQINIQVPDDANRGLVNVTVTNSNGTSAPQKVNMTGYAPAFATLGKYVNAQHGDSSIVAPAGMLPGSTPAMPGETIVLYGFGFGPTNPQRLSGQIVQGAQLADPSQLRISIGGIQSNIKFSGLIGAGIYQFNVVVPQSVAEGDQLIQASIAGFQSQPSISVPIKSNFNTISGSSSARPFPSAPGAPFKDGVASGKTLFLNINNVTVGEIDWTVTFEPSRNLHTVGTVKNLTRCFIPLTGMTTRYWEYFDVTHKIAGFLNYNIYNQGMGRVGFNEVAPQQSFSFDLREGKVSAAGQDALAWVEEVAPDVNAYGSSDPEGGSTYFDAILQIGISDQIVAGTGTYRIQSRCMDALH